MAAHRCPHCGAPATPGQARCAYCDSVLRAGREPRCPRCRRPLGAQLVTDVPVDRCDDCGGLWVHHEVFARLRSDAVGQRELATELARAPRPRRKAARGGHGKLPCPDCRRAMAPLSVDERSRAVLDLCREHGVWFDHDELDEVVRFVRRRRAEPDREGRRGKSRRRKRRLADLGDLVEDLLDFVEDVFD